MKEEPAAEECKQEPMEADEKKPEVKGEVKEEEDTTNSATQSSPASGQSRKKSTYNNFFPCDDEGRRCK